MPMPDHVRIVGIRAVWIDDEAEKLHLQIVGSDGVRYDTRWSFESLHRFIESAEPIHPIGSTVQ